MPRVLGLDVGIGSCGWAVVDLPDVDPATGEVTGEFAIKACGARCFPIPEEPKTKQLKNEARRMARGQRRVIRRRRERLAEVRAALAKAGLAEPGPDPAGTVAGHVWALRAAGLERLLTPAEFAKVLVHIAKHRGFKNNSKRDRANDAASTAFQKQISATQNRLVLGGYSTFGEMAAKDEAFRLRKRNVSGDYRRTPLRRDLESEASKLFEAQRRFGMVAASPELEAGYTLAAFFQRPFGQGDKMVGWCTMEPKEKRCPRYAPSFERFRFLQSINNARVVPPGARARPLDADERARVHTLFASKIEVTYRDVHKALQLPELTFEGLSGKDRDPFKKRFARFEGSRLLQDVLGEVEFANSLAQRPETLDAVMAAVVFNEEPGQIAAGAVGAGLTQAEAERLTSEEMLARASSFRGVGHLSALACRRLLPGLEAGLNYEAACKAIGYDPENSGTQRIEDITNPVVRKVLAQCLKQVQAVIKRFGMPDFVHFEMARDVGKSPEERNAIKTGQDERGAARDRAVAELKRLLPDEFGNREPSGVEILRFELCRDQQNRCPYTGTYISPAQVVATDNSLQIDHILPRSRSADNSYHNKVLCTVAANQEKGNQTPYEWFGECDPERWRQFKAQVEGNSQLRGMKKRNLLMTTFKDLETKYAERNLNDTRWSMRVLRKEMERQWPVLHIRENEVRRLFVRPGSVTALVRKAWGLNSLKRDGLLGDRDHALDAIVVACTSERLLQRVTAAHKEKEAIRWHRELPEVTDWLGGTDEQRERFRLLVRDAAMGVFVSRPETRRGRGPAHGETLYAFDTRADGKEVQFERRAVVALAPDDLDRMAGETARIEPLRTVLRDWLQRAATYPGKAAKLFEADPPRMPGTGLNQPIIRTIRLLRKKTFSGMKIDRGGALVHVDLDSMVRTDVFFQAGKFYLIPIYAWQLADKKRFPTPPRKAVVAYKDEAEWFDVGPSADFRFSLYPGTYVLALNRAGDMFEGYYSSMNRSVATITLTNHAHVGKPIGPGTKTLVQFRKFNVDRFGHKHEVVRERREWHGEVCS